MIIFYPFPAFLGTLIYFFSYICVVNLILNVVTIPYRKYMYNYIQPREHPLVRPPPLHHTYTQGFIIALLVNFSDQRSSGRTQTITTHYSLLHLARA